LVEPMLVDPASSIEVGEADLNDEMLFGPAPGLGWVRKFLGVEYLSDNAHYYTIYAVENMLWPDETEYESAEAALAATSYSKGWFTPEWRQPMPEYSARQLSGYLGWGFVTDLSIEMMAGRFQTKEGTNYRIVAEKIQMTVASEGPLEGSTVQGPFDFFAVLEVYPEDTEPGVYHFKAAQIANMKDCDPWQDVNGKQTQEH